jgi:hypothetical protein
MMTKKIWNIILPKNSVKIEILADFLLSKNTDELWAILSNLVRVSPSLADTDTESLQSP